MNSNPGQIVVSNNNWQDNIEYIGSGGGYDITYIYNFNTNEVEVIERDSLGNVIEEESLITSFNVILSNNRYFGKGFFVSGEDMNLKITEN